MKYSRRLPVFAAALFLFACGDATHLEQADYEPEEEAVTRTEALSSPPNPGARGDHAVTSATYGSDAQRTELDGILSEHLGQVHFPSDMQNGPYPLVLIMHGDHETCESPSGTKVEDEWPCAAPNQPVPSYRGYDYLADLLASHGMIVASISANGMNAPDDTVAVPRELLIRNHMNQFHHFHRFGDEAFNAFPGAELFQGMVDLDNVGLVGHSRGGAAVMNFTAAVDDPVGTVRAILPIAQTNSQTVNNIPVAMLQGYCDGDLNRPRMGVFDDARYADPSDETEKYTFVAMGANHNFFNEVWSPAPSEPQPAHTSDDAQDRYAGDAHCDATIPGNGRLTKDEQQALAKIWVAAFLRRHLLGATEFDPVLKGDVTPFPAPINDTVKVGYHAGASDRRDVNTLDNADLFESGLNELGDSFELDGFTDPELCDVDRCVTEGRDAHRHQVLQLAWETPGAEFENQVPTSSRNVRGFSALQFRVGTDHGDELNPTDRDFRVVLRDRRGSTASAKASDFTNGLEFPPGDDDNRRAIMTTVRIPLSAFSGVNLRRIRSVNFVFDESETGNLLFSDLAFSE